METLGAGESDVPELTLDCMRHLTRFCTWRDLLQLACVSRSWKAVATSNESWQGIFAQEFGPWHGGTEPDDWHQAFVEFQHTGGAHHASLCAKFTAALDAIDGFELVFGGMHSSSYLIVRPNMVFRTGQSVWVKFLLPRDTQHFGDLRIMASLKWGFPLCVIESPSFSIPTNDMARMLQSHKEGIYAWRELGETLPSGERDPAWLVAYIHYEQLLRLWPRPLPQIFPSQLLPNPGAVNSNTLQLFLEFSSLPGECCLGRMQVSSLQRARPQPQASSASTPPPPEASTSSGPLPSTNAFVDSLVESLLPLKLCYQTSLSSEGVVLSTPEQANVGKQERGQVLEAILNGACLLDFVLMDNGNGLLLGRAGVEVWQEDIEDLQARLPEPRYIYSARFLPDGVEANMRDNSIRIDPTAGLLSLLLSCEPHQLGCSSSAP